MISIHFVVNVDDKMREIERFNGPHSSPRATRIHTLLISDASNTCPGNIVRQTRVTWV